MDAATWVPTTRATSPRRQSPVPSELFAAYSNVPISVDVTPVAVGDSLTTVTVESTQPEDDPDPFPNTQELTVPVVDAAVDLGITVGHFPPVVIGEQENVTAMVTNAGPAVARTTSYLWWSLTTSQSTGRASRSVGHPRMPPAAS